jgi:hypothetical protein
MAERAAVVNEQATRLARINSDIHERRWDWMHNDMAPVTQQELAELLGLANDAIKRPFRFSLNQRVAFSGCATTGRVNRLMIDENGRKLVEVEHMATKYEYKRSLWKLGLAGDFKAVGQGLVLNFYHEEQLCEAAA